MCSFHLLFYLFFFLLLLLLDFDVFTLNILLLCAKWRLLAPKLSLLNFIINLDFLIILLPSTGFSAAATTYWALLNFILNYYVIPKLAGAHHHFQLFTCFHSFASGLTSCSACPWSHAARAHLLSTGIAEGLPPVFCSFLSEITILSSLRLPIA